MALLGFLKELSFWCLLALAWPEERAMVFFHCTLSIHHVGHISFWGYCPAVLAVVPHMPLSPAWSVVLRVAAWWSAEAEGRSVHSFAGRRWGRRDFTPGC